MEDLNDKITGDSLTAAEWNQVPSELQNVIEAVGQTLSGVNLNQLGIGIAAYVSNGNFYLDSGAANAYVLSPIGAKQSLPSYGNGLYAEFIAANTNTGASTVNIGSKGVKNIVNTSTGGEIVAGVRYGLKYRSGTDDYEIYTPSFNNLTTGLAATTQQGALDEGLGTNLNRVSKVWVNFNGTGVIAIRDSYNVSSLTDNGTGNYSVNFTTAMANANYAVAVSGNQEDVLADTYAVGSVVLQSFDSSGVPLDISIICCMVLANG